MPTVDELLNASNEVTTCTINPDTREIIVPEKYKVLGVFSDEKVTKIPFTCPRVVGNNVDLTEYNLYINYQNASGASSAYLIDDIVVSGDNITFSWLLSRYVTFSPGVVKYSFCAKKLDGDTISNEWNTTIATGLVIQGLEATREIIEENPDIIEALISKAHTHENKGTLDTLSISNGKLLCNGSDVGGEWELLGELNASTADVLRLEFPSPMRKIIFKTKIVDSAGEANSASTKAYRTISLLTDRWRSLAGVQIGMSSHSWGIVCIGNMMCEQEFSWGEIGRPSLTATTSLNCIAPARQTARDTYYVGNVRGIQFASVIPAGTENTASGTITVWGVRA